MDVLNARDQADLSLRSTLLTVAVSVEIQSTLVISMSKGPPEILRDIRTSTYQMCSIKENTN